MEMEQPRPKTALKCSIPLTSLPSMCVSLDCSMSFQSHWPHISLTVSSFVAFREFSMTGQLHFSLFSNWVHNNSVKSIQSCMCPTCTRRNPSMSISMGIWCRGAVGMGKRWRCSMLGCKRWERISGSSCCPQHCYYLCSVPELQKASLVDRFFQLCLSDILRWWAAHKIVIYVKILTKM